ncbi:PREDICTED: inositol hexakisphosphate and diphosphoinositol-pentakisphosphate kinase 2-like [Priapulus caudatus]|uniref:Inositol hexakisphosphate and diphosphoinositol-pentakisphosphate kinase n=1 Tax=Priapulus caudatus TaxID=37621 RepID=A0ABM1F5W7_PRICU|nr:PREDICTED: inositol hexakisphosphate and diphosphoinositol-pentakisphosphate kinase 2-like [Priapulus caudatus]
MSSCVSSHRAARRTDSTILLQIQCDSEKALHDYESAVEHKRKHFHAERQQSIVDPASYTIPPPPASDGSTDDGAQSFSRSISANSNSKSSSNISHSQSYYSSDLPPEVTSYYITDGTDGRSVEDMNKAMSSSLSETRVLEYSPSSEKLSSSLPESESQRAARMPTARARMHAQQQPQQQQQQQQQDNAPRFFIGDRTQSQSEASESSDLDDEGDCDETINETLPKVVTVGICAMRKKSNSKPMKEILERLENWKYIQTLIFDEDQILQEPVEKWPVCECLISFHSQDFPLRKAQEYAELRMPFLINDIRAQFTLQDRRIVYKTLASQGIELPRYAVLDRDSDNPHECTLVEGDDHIEVNGVIFNKPFVEKPVNAEDHNIYIYYPTSAGGGSQRLFRKVGSRSSVYSPEIKVRKTGSYIYEDFMPTDGTDVKVYTVGPEYAHAEARKSPALDGKVERDSEGKEVRYPVILGNEEKFIARKVCLAFKQMVCGFDLLRADGKAYVCDVNGFSFVKNSVKYYDDCAYLLGNVILRKLAPQLDIPWKIPHQLEDPPFVPTTFGRMMELRCVIAVIRHGDRTPKQKMKMEVKHGKFFHIFQKYGGFKNGQLKLKKPKQLQEILDVARYLLDEIRHKSEPDIEEKKSNLEQLKAVLEMYGHFSGINRKVQLKYLPTGRPRKDKQSSSEDDQSGSPSLILILKWGGELTPAGRIQAEELGKAFRFVYPGGQADNPGCGLLRLHSTYRHDLKIYASDEGRVQMTAAAFAKGFLALEGELTPILVQMVKSANTNGLLDNDCESSKYQNMRMRRSRSRARLWDIDDNACKGLYILIKGYVSDVELYHEETWELMLRRWSKLEKDFKTKTGLFDISKIPDIYDCIKYDMQHNQMHLHFDDTEELYLCSKSLADIIIPQEYGITVEDKLTISQGICLALLRKIRSDILNVITPDESTHRLNPKYSKGVMSPGRNVRTRLYFTSESHIHSLLNVLRYGSLVSNPEDEQWQRAMEYVSSVSELNYLTQIVIMLYEDPSKDPQSEHRFHVELHFSPGAICCLPEHCSGPGFRPHSRNENQEEGVSPPVDKVNFSPLAEEERFFQPVSEDETLDTKEVVSPATSVKEDGKSSPITIQRRKAAVMQASNSMAASRSDPLFNTDEGLGVDGGYDAEADNAVSPIITVLKKLSRPHSLDEKKGIGRPTRHSVHTVPTMTDVKDTSRATRPVSLFSTIGDQWVVSSAPDDLLVLEREPDGSAFQ